MTKKELYDSVNQILNDVGDLREELDTVVRGLKKLERDLELLPGDDNPLEEDPAETEISELLD